MEYRILGKDNGGLKVSAVGLGCMGLSHAYGAASSLEDAHDLLASAVDFGVTFFDTAEVYGNDIDPHHNEKLVGEILKPYRNKVVIATKFGISFDMSVEGATHPLVPDASPETIRKSVEGSLRRLQTDHIDLYYQHRIDPKVSPEEVASVMADLIKEGKILHWGVSEATEDYIRRAHKVCPITAIENRYSMMARWHESLFPVHEELGIGFVAFSPMANGLLTGNYDANSTFDKKTDFRASMPQFQKESFEQNRQLIALVEDIADKKHATPAMVSLAWMMSKKDYIVPIPGTRKIYRLKENIGAADIHLTKQEVADIDAALDKMPMSQVFGGSSVEVK